MADTIRFYRENGIEPPFQERIEDLAGFSVSNVAFADQQVISVTYDDGNIAAELDFAMEHEGYSFLHLDTVNPLLGIHHWGAFTTANEPTDSLITGDTGFDTTKGVHVFSVDATNWGEKTAYKARVGFAVTTDTATLGRFSIYACTDTAAPRTLTLSTADIAFGSTARPCFLTVKDESGGAAAQNITIDTQGAETIDGAASVVISANYGSVTLYSDGSNLFIV